MNRKTQQEKFRAFERNGQLVLALNSEIMLPEDAPVRRTSAQLEELEYGKLYGMKEDHMRNGQLKPAYNVQIAVNSEYITGIEVFSNRTNYGTLEPFLEEVSGYHGCRYSKVVADSGYESLNNYTYFEKNDL